MIFEKKGRCGCVFNNYPMQLVYLKLLIYCFRFFLFFNTILVKKYANHNR